MQKPYQDVVSCKERVRNNEANRNDPFFATTTNSSPVVISQLCTTFLIWANYLPCQLSILQEKFHPFHLKKSESMTSYTRLLDLRARQNIRSTWGSSKLAGLYWPCRSPVWLSGVAS